MPSIQLDCPYCGGSGASFELLADQPSKLVGGDFFSLARCGVCKEVVMIKFRDRRGSGQPPIAIGKSSPVIDGFHVLEVHPKSPEPRIADHIPENVASMILEGEQCFASGYYSASASCYRKAMERSLRHLNPGETGMLHKRIRQLEKSNIVPHSLIELLDEVRLFGNAAMHEDEIDPTKDDVEAAREFSHLFLTYAFSLPKRVELAKLRRAEADESPATS